MHPINGLQLDEWAKERYERTINNAQRELRAEALKKQHAGNWVDWFRGLLTDRRLRPGKSLDGKGDSFVQSSER